MVLIFLVYVFVFLWFLPYNLFSVWATFFGFFVVIFLTIMLYCTFSSISLLSFYMFFESILITTLFLILCWGYQPERVRVGIYLLFYTFFDSFPLLVGILFIYNT